MLPHPTTPIITFDGIVAFLGGAGLLARVLVFGVMAAIIFFAVTHLRLLAWNLREYMRFGAT